MCSALSESLPKLLPFFWNLFHFDQPSPAPAAQEVMDEAHAVDATHVTWPVTGSVRVTRTWLTSAAAIGPGSRALKFQVGEYLAPGAGSDANSRTHRRPSHHEVVD